LKKGTYVCYNGSAGKGTYVWKISHRNRRCQVRATAELLKGGTGNGICNWYKFMGSRRGQRQRNAKENCLSVLVYQYREGDAPDAEDSG